MNNASKGKTRKKPFTPGNKPKAQKREMPKHEFAPGSMPAWMLG